MLGQLAAKGCLSEAQSCCHCLHMSACPDLYVCCKCVCAVSVYVCCKCVCVCVCMCAVSVCLCVCLWLANGSRFENFIIAFGFLASIDAPLWQLSSCSPFSSFLLPLSLLLSLPLYLSLCLVPAVFVERFHLPPFVALTVASF